MWIGLMAKQGEGGLSLLEVDPGLVIWTFIIFGIVVFLLRRFAWAPISQALDQRANRVHEDLKRAEDLKQQAEQKLGEYLEKLDGWEEEGQKLREKSRKEALETRESLITQAKVEAAAILERSREEIVLAKDQAVRELRQQIVRYSSFVASQILERELRPEDHEKLALQAMEDIQRGPQS